MDVRIRAIEFAKALGFLRGVSDAGVEVNGPLATFSSLLSYARFIETGRSSKPQVRRAGPARMFARGAADAARYAVGVLPTAVIKGPRAAGQAKRRVRDYGIERIRQYTPVRTGRLRASVRVLERPS